MANTKNQSKRKYHIIYKITNIVNNKIYIGAHSTDNINDLYYGSGTNIVRAIDKYGISLFQKDILYIYDTPAKMFEKEKEIVTSDFLSRTDVYNIVEGGYGGFNNGSKGLKHIHNPTTNERMAVHPNAIPKLLEEGWVIGRNMSSTTNTIWIHKNLEKKMINPNKLNQYVSQGWTKGLPESPTANKIWIFNKTSNEYSLCSMENLEGKLSQGWIKKKWSPVKKGSCWINNGENNLRVINDRLNHYLDSGLKKGMITARW